MSFEPERIASIINSDWDHFTIHDYDSPFTIHIMSNTYFRRRFIRDVFDLEFPSGCIAKGVSSYSMNINYLGVKAEKGDFELSEAYRYGGMADKTPTGPMNFPQINQQAAQMDDFANCITQNRNTIVPGEMGMQDMRIVEAIYRSVASGKREGI